MDSTQEMRMLIINYLDRIKRETNNFSRDTMRWRNRLFEGIYFSEVDYTSLSNEKLFEFFCASFIIYNRQYG